MKKIFLLLAAAVSLSSAAPGWVTDVFIKQIWVLPGPTPVVTITTSELPANFGYGFYLNANGNSNLLKLAEDAMAGNFSVKIYTDHANGYTYFKPGLNAPYIADASAYPLYSIAINR
jgi:hypothetical protein